MGRKTIHVSISVRGIIAYDARMLKRATNWITGPGGKRFTPRELRDAMMDELAQGHEVLPFGAACEGFDYKTGCPGHVEQEAAND